MQSTKKPTSKLALAFRTLPILGELVDSKWEDHRASLKEFSVVFVFATATFWLSALFLMALEQNKTKGFADLLLTTVRSGELFIFCVAFLGPVLVTALEDPSGARPFPGRFWHIGALVVLGIVCAGFYALTRVTATTIDLNRDFLLTASITLAVATVVLRYLAMVYRKSTLRPDETIREKEENFAESFASRHKSQRDV